MGFGDLFKHKVNKDIDVNKIISPVINRYCELMEENQKSEEKMLEYVKFEILTGKEPGDFSQNSEEGIYRREKIFNRDDYLRKYLVGTVLSIGSSKGAHLIGVVPNDRMAYFERDELYLGLSAMTAGQTILTPFSNATFDQIYSYNLLLERDQANKIVRELLRVNKPAGYLVFEFVYQVPALLESTLRAIYNVLIECQVPIEGNNELIINEILAKHPLYPITLYRPIVYAVVKLG